jgi:hypothetical protein
VRRQADFAKSRGSTKIKVRTPALIESAEAETRAAFRKQQQIADHFLQRMVQSGEVSLFDRHRLFEILNNIIRDILVTTFLYWYKHVS